MEEVILRFPHLAKNIFEQVDHKTMANCAETSKSWRKFLNEEGIYPGILQKDMIISYTKCSRGYLQKVLQTTSLETLAFEVRYLFKRMHYHGVEKELKYLKQSAKLGYLGVYQLLSERLEDKNPYVEEYFFHETNLHEAAGQGHLSICQFIMKHTVHRGGIYQFFVHFFFV